MKKIIIILSLLLATSYALKAQYAYKPFRFDIGMGASIPTSSNTVGAGVLFFMEPKFSVLPRLSVGLRMEVNTLFSGNFYYDYDGYLERDNLEIKVNTAFLATVDYHFTTGTFRPFVGGGVGLYHLAGARIDSDDYYYYDDDYYPDYGLREYYPSTNFGGMLRAGFDVTHFRFALEYNFAGNNYDVNFNYFAITLGGYIGGGKRR